MCPTRSYIVLRRRLRNAVQSLPEKEVPLRDEELKDAEIAGPSCLLSPEQDVAPDYTTKAGRVKKNEMYESMRWA